MCLKSKHIFNNKLLTLKLVSFSLQNSCITSIANGMQLNRRSTKFISLLSNVAKAGLQKEEKQKIEQLEKQISILKLWQTLFAVFLFFALDYLNQSPYLPRRLKGCSLCRYFYITSYLLCIYSLTLLLLHLKQQHAKLA